jgi:hypothetical protein
MPKFNKSLEQLNNHCDRWLYFIKNLANLEDIPELFKDDVIYQGFETPRIATLDNKDRQSYETSLKEYRDLYSVMKTAREEGREEGLEEGIEKGREGNQSQSAINLI